MNEDYVSLEVAKLLKEKGFDWFCEKRYIENDEHDYEPDGKVLVYVGFIYYKKPTLYMAQKWLREEKEIHIMNDVCASGYYAVLWKTNGTFIKTMADKGPNDGGVWDTYEQCLNDAILEALKLI